jgi:hypothetical protein
MQTKRLTVSRAISPKRKQPSLACGVLWSQRMRSRTNVISSLLLAALVGCGDADRAANEDGGADAVDASGTDAAVDGPDGGQNGGDPNRLLYWEADIARFISRMDGSGPFYARGDAGHGGQFSPNDGERSEQLAAEFLANPQESY